MAVTLSDIKDLIVSTRTHQARNKFWDVSQQLTRFEAMGYYLRKGSPNLIQQDGGIGIDETLMNKASNAARHVPLFAQTVLSNRNLMAKLSAPFVHAETHYLWERREALMNAGPEKLVDMIAARRRASKLALAAELEDKFTTLRDVNDSETPNGLFYYIVRNATVGFNGGAPSGHTTVAGINPDLEPNYKNYTGTYKAFTPASVGRLLKKAKLETRFLSPIPGDSATVTRSNQRSHRIYVNQNTLFEFDDMAAQQNDRLGLDVASPGELRRLPELTKEDGTGAVMFAGHYFIYLPKLDSDTTNPIITLDMDTVFVYVLKGDMFYEHDPEVLVGTSSNTLYCQTDISYQYLIPERRSNSIVYQDAAGV